MKLLLSTMILTASIMKVQMCGPEGSFSIAGSSTVLPVAELWASAYKEMCPGAQITVEGGGSSAGAGRVCANGEKGTPVEIGDMSRGWKDTEATADDPDYIYQCVAGDTSRSAIQIDVAIDGLSVATQAGGPGDACIEALGGLTTDQLRWIFTSYKDTELEASGWDPVSLANSDGDETTHLWSELSADCPAAEIKIAGADEQSGTYEYFLETILTDFDNGESFGTNRPDGYFNSEVDDEIVAFLEENGDAIAYFGYAYYFENQDTLAAAAIENSDGDFVLPDSSTVADGSYNPLARRIYMNLLNDEAALQYTRPFIQFGLSDAGSALVAETGYVALPEADIQEMLSRLPEAAPTGPAPTPTANPPTASPPTDAPSPNGEGEPTTSSATKMVVAVSIICFTSLIVVFP